MTNYPITPPPELVRQWDSEAVAAEMPEQLYIATMAARWGADQELEACLAEVSFFGSRVLADKLRAARRPKPPSLKEQALQALDSFEGFTGSLQEVNTIRRALEQLDD